MSDSVSAALIAVGGVVVGSVLTGLIQFFVTRLVIQSEQAKLSKQLQAEQQKLIEQLRNESRFRRWEAKYNRITELVGEFIAATEIESSPKKEVWLPLLHKIQVLLRYDNGPEQKLNGAINDVAFALSDGQTDTRSCLAVSAELIESAKALLAQYHHSP